MDSHHGWSFTNVPEYTLSFGVLSNRDNDTLLKTLTALPQKPACEAEAMAYRSVLLGLFLERKQQHDRCDPTSPFLFSG